MAIHLDVPRLKCHDCVRTFTAVVPEVDADRQMTERLVKWIGRQSLEYSFEVLRAKVLFTDVLQRRARRVEQVKRRPQFEELEGARMFFSLGRCLPEEPQYDVQNVVREVTLGTDLSTLLAEIDHWPTRG